MKRVLITGARGLLGTPTAEAFAADAQWETVALAHAHLDIADADRVRAVMAEHRPDLVVNCAAYTKVDDCETSEALALRVNADGAGHVARACAELGTRLIHLSTDYVFDGMGGARPYREDDPTAPPERLGVYARSKLLGERQVFAALPNALIVRTAWVFGEDAPCFPRTILRLAKEKPQLSVVDDQRGSPTYARDLAAALLRLADMDARGLLHVANAGDCTWYEFACEIMLLAGLTTPVEPVTTAQFPRPARRPAYSVMDCGAYERLTGAPLRRWESALADHLDRNR